MTNVSDIFLAQFLRLETSSKPFHGFNSKMLILSFFSS